MPESIEGDSIFYAQVTPLKESVRLLGDVDGVIESAGGWAVR